ncbi:MAG: hypothetical protein DMF86_23155 [Acidobacteria bacterium]|nr:MAG: hypothetical protein DMF86_23155 [Acidobacteriota bacterium]
MIRGIACRVCFAGALAIAGPGNGAAAQVPQPFPRPGDTKPASPAPQRPAPQVQPPTAPGDPAEPNLGVPIYPGAQFLGSFDAGRGQRYYIYGTNSDFIEIVTYYKTILKMKGDLVYEEPPIHEFDIGKFKEETMAFPPSVTVKDYTRGGSAGYLNPKRGAQPARFKTVIQIVPLPPM